MNSKDKEKPITRVKQFFRSVGRNAGGNAKETDLRPGLETELRPETPVPQRCKTLKELGEQLRSMNLEEPTVTKLWNLTKDLIVDNKSTEHRQTTLNFYKILIQTQFKNLTIMREHFFLVIQNHEVPEDLKQRLELLNVLTENGKTITNFEEKIGKFMLEWLPSIESGFLLHQYLEILVNLIKFNAAHLDNEIVVGIVQNACRLSYPPKDEAIGLQCLNILELVICYTIFPNETLALCVDTLCRTVNHVSYCQTSWKNMMKLLGTNLGCSSLLIMCNFLNDKKYYNDPILLRGAVFHINMGIFGSSPPLNFLPKFSTKSSVLMSFLHVLESKILIVTFEVILSIQNVVSKYGEELPERIWDIICEILTAISDNIAHYERGGLCKDFSLLKDNFHKTIDFIENLIHANKLMANKDLIYDLIERVSENRPEDSVLSLIDYRSKKISATKPEWLAALNDFVCRFYRIPNTNIRMKTIHSLILIMDASRASYEEEILQRVVIPQFGGIANEPDPMIRVVVCKALIEFSLHCDTKRCTELIDILEKVLNRPFEQYITDESVCKSEDEIQDVTTVVDGLIRIFVVKLYRLPSSHAIRVFNILVGHLEQHYQKPKVFEHVNIVRNKIFAWMLKARANASYHIGYPDHETRTIRFSPYLGIDSSLPMHGISGHSVPIGQEHLAMNFTTISIRRACKIIVKCIEEDKDYNIFQMVIKALPHILQNKALILGNDIEALTSALCNALPDPKSSLRTFHTAKPSSDDFNGLLLPAIASLVVYHQYISSDLKLKMIEAVKVVIRSNANAHICINTLLIMILEMPETLSRQLAEVLLEISKMSRTASVAIPVLEFLSILSRLPNDLFSNFVPKHYMYVFAVSLSYTKPHPYNHYIASLAHHVMTGWLLKCKMSMRKNFVMYIISGLQTDTNMLKEPTLRNEDSSNRQRSASLSERVSRNKDNAPDMKVDLHNIQAELAETCIDFLARHTFSPCSTLPKRLPAVECMLKDGISQTWMVGHNLVTITTTGCPSAPKANGLCERCSLLMNKSNSLYAKSEVTGTPNSYTGAPIPPEVVGKIGPTTISDTSINAQAFNRRYTKASLQYSSGTDSGTSTDLTSTSTSSSSQHQTNRQTSNSSSVSLEALSRRGSNPEPENRIESSSALGNSLNQLSNVSSSTSSSQQPTCARSCTGWAEIYVRRPTGNISWIMHIQNPIANDCLGTDLPLNELISLFLPTMHGGVFGPDFVEEAKLLSPAPPLATLSPRKPVEQERKDLRLVDAAKLPTVRTRALKRQEEVSSTVSTSGPIDIPKSSKRGKEPSGSVSDGEADEDGAAFEDGRTRARNPVRRVNSSPEMSSSLRKPPGKDFNTVGPPLFAPNEQEDAIKKKVAVSSGYTKDIRVSCEAIPEEIAGSTPPSLTDSLKDDEKLQSAAPTKQGLEVTAAGGKEQSLPPKQHSADDATNQISVNPVTCSTSATSLKIPLDLQKINTSAKAPQSAAPLSPRLLAKNAAIKVASFSSNVGMGMGEYGNNNGDMIRGRSKTISVVREVNGKSRTPLALPSFGVAKTQINSKLGINPSFVFLQLFHNGQLQCSDPPLKVGADNMATITVLDLIPPFETHKFGVLYVGPGQCNNEVQILKNRYGSVRYVEFLRNIGTLVSLKDAKENNLFVNMDTNGSDGNFTYIWKDDVVQITFHVATLMPNHDNDPNCNEKKKHIGNDYVSIVYNESGEEYNLNTIKGQFNYACVVVQPLELNMNRVFVKARDEIENYVCHPEPKIVSDRSAPLLARQLALHANLASHVYQSTMFQNHYASNWAERLRKLKNLRTKLLKENNDSQPSSWW